MSHQSAPPEAVYIIRHGEKPQDLAPKHPTANSGVDFRGNQNEHSLLPRGWQRSGALAALFEPTHGPLRPGLRVPRILISPSYGHPSKTADHRTHQTIRGLSDRLGVEIAADFAKGQEPQLATAVLNSGPGAVLICWEHSHIPALASALPHISSSAIQPGDLLYYDGIGHVAIYVGDGYIIDAPQTGMDVEKIPMDNSWFAANFAGAARP